MRLRKEVWFHRESRAKAGFVSEKITAIGGGTPMYKASVENRGDSKFYASTRHSSFVLDTEGNGANPVDTLLASLCGCLGHYVRDYLAERNVGNNGFSITAEAGTTVDKALLSGIKVRVDLSGARLDKQQSAELVQHMERCKIHRVLRSGTGVEISAY